MLFLKLLWTPKNEGVTGDGTAEPCAGVIWADPTSYPAEKLLSLLEEGILIPWRSDVRLDTGSGTRSSSGPARLGLRFLLPLRVLQGSPLSDLGLQQLDDSADACLHRATPPRGHRPRSPRGCGRVLTVERPYTPRHGRCLGWTRSCPGRRPFGLEPSFVLPPFLTCHPHPTHPKFDSSAPGG